MHTRVRYFALGTVLALATIGLAIFISWLVDLNMILISVLLLSLLILAIFSNTLSSAAGGPTMRPSAGGSNPWSVTTSSLSLQELESTDHMMEESRRQQTPALPKESRYRWMALPSGIAILLILLSYIF